MAWIPRQKPPTVVQWRWFPLQTPSSQTILCPPPLHEFVLSKIINSNWTMASTSVRVALGPQRFLSLDDFEFGGEGIPVLLRKQLSPSPHQINFSDYPVRYYTKNHAPASSLGHTPLGADRCWYPWKKPLLKIKVIRISLTLRIKLEQQR